QTFRSPLAVLIWWVWVLFAIANLIDLAVQGRDHLSVVAAFILVLVTGVVYAAAQRPRIIAADDGLTIVNPLREHRARWASVAGIDSTDLVRVRCEWPLDSARDEADEADEADAPATGKRVIHSWAVQTARRRQFTAQVRAERRAVRRPGTGTGTRSAAGPGGTFGAFAEAGGDATPAGVGDVAYVVAALRARVAQEHAANPGQRAEPPVTTWYWPAFAAILVPALALVIAILVLPAGRTRRPYAGSWLSPADGGLDGRVRSHST
uniref:PH domain-containing protein n=1 Tax=Trebonia sp. TaxID=2767075 RepID=UPI002608B276